MDLYRVAKREINFRFPSEPHITPYDNSPLTLSPPYTLFIHRFHFTFLPLLPPSQRGHHTHLLFTARLLHLLSLLLSPLLFHPRVSNIFLLHKLPFIHSPSRPSLPYTLSYQRYFFFLGKVVIRTGKGLVVGVHVERRKDKSVQFFLHLHLLSTLLLT